MLTLSVLWFGTILVAILVMSGSIGARFGLTNAGMGIGTAVLLVLFVGAPILLYLLDAQLASRVPRLRDSRILAGLVRLLRRIAGLAYPQRLVLPVQLTLQSNTRPVAFFVALTISIMIIVAVGNTRAAAWRNFTLSGEFAYLDTVQIQEGLRSTYYEDMPNLVLDQLCGSAEEAPDRVACLRQLWTVGIDGRPVSMASFEPAERADLGMRGLIGLVPLAGLEPGLRRIEVVWNPSAGEEGTPLDDRYAQLNSRYVIPIAFSPDFEISLD